MPDEKAKFILATNHSKLIKVRDAFITEGSINTLRCKFEFRTSDWNNTTKTAMFVGGRAMPSTPTEDIKPMLLDENNECDVPSEVLANGTFSVGVFGVREDYRIVSNWMYYRIADGCFAEGSAPLEPTPTIYEQILQEFQKKTRIQSNWTQTDENADDYIKNKPTILTEEYVLQKIKEVIGDLDNNTVMAKKFIVSLLSDNWVGDTSPYSQVIDVPGVTATSKIDLQPSMEQLVIFYEKDLAFVTENNKGVVTVYAIGDKPLNDYQIQATITEVSLDG